MTVTSLSPPVSSRRTDNAEARVDESRDPNPSSMNRAPSWAPLRLWSSISARASASEAGTSLLQRVSSGCGPFP
jgi:hypothetical protein